MVRAFIELGEKINREPNTGKCIFYGNFFSFSVKYITNYNKSPREIEDGEAGSRKRRESYEGII